jgi:hypothetical protein
MSLPVRDLENPVSAPLPCGAQTSTKTAINTAEQSKVTDKKITRYQVH